MSHRVEYTTYLKWDAVEGYTAPFRVFAGSPEEAAGKRMSLLDHPADYTGIAVLGPGEAPPFLSQSVWVFDLKRETTITPVLR